MKSKVHKNKTFRITSSLFYHSNIMILKPHIRTCLESYLSFFVSYNFISQSKTFIIHTCKYNIITPYPYNYHNRARAKSKFFSSLLFKFKFYPFNKKNPWMNLKYLWLCIIMHKKLWIVQQKKLLFTNLHSNASVPFVASPDIVSHVP